MAGPAERRLSKALEAHPARLHDAAAAWRTAAQGLGDVADALETGSARIAASWQGRDADAATGAFTDLATTVRKNQTRMTEAAAALDVAGTALHQAKAEFAKLPPVPPVPTAPEPDDTGSVPIEREVQYLKLSGRRATAMSSREAAADSAYAELVVTLGDARTQLATAAPAHEHDFQDPTGPGAGGDRPPIPGTPGLPGSGYTPVGVYSTSTGGTHSGKHVISTAAPHLDPTTCSGHLVNPTVTTDTTADGLVGGTVPGLDGQPGATTVGQGVLGGSTGSLTSGSMSGLAGVVGGGGGLLGAMRGAKAGSSTAGGAAGAARGLAPGTPGVVSDGTVGGSTAKAGVTGSVLGTGGRPAGPGALGSPGTTAAAGGTRPGTLAPGAAGAPASGGAQGGATSAGGRTGGRYLAGDAGAGASGSRQSGGTPGHGTGSSGMQSGGRGADGDHEREDARRGMVFEDEDAWIDDDDLGPGVMR